MIFDSIKNSKIYFGVNPKFEKAFEFIQKAIEEWPELGKYEIDGDEIYALVQSYDTKQIDDCCFEGHRNYIDIQYVAEGIEVFGTIDVSKALVKDEYNEEKDVTFYHESSGASYCVANAGDFCVFYPHDIHRPCVAFENTPSNIRKIVFKVHI